MRTDVRDRGWPGATVQETRGTPTQARSAESNRRDPGDDESRCGEAVIVREIGSAPCKILNRDDHGDALVVAAPVGFTVPARSPALMRTGICLDNTGEIRAEVLEIGEWCNQNCVSVSGYELDYHDGSIIVCINHRGKKNLHVTTEEAAFQVRFYRGNMLLRPKLCQGQGTTQPPMKRVGNKRLSRMSKGQIPLPRGCLPAMRESNANSHQGAGGRGVAQWPNNSRDTRTTPGNDETPDFEELLTCGKETPPHKGVRVAQYGKLLVVARGNELSEGPRVRVADIPWGESEGIVILLPERRAPPGSVEAWRHRKLREPNIEEQANVMVIAEACEAAENKQMPMLLIKPEGTVMYAGAFEYLGRAHKLGKPVYVQRVAGLENKRPDTYTGMYFLSSSAMGFTPASIISGTADTWYCHQPQWFDNVKAALKRLRERERNILNVLRMLRVRKPGAWQ